MSKRGTFRPGRLLSASGLVLLSIFSSAMSLKAQDFSPSARQTDFHWFCVNFADNYAYADRTERPWKTWEVRYADAVKRATTPVAYASVLESALDELHDFHAEVRSPNPHRWLPVPTFADVWAEFRGPDAAVIAVRKGSDAERFGVSVGDRIKEVGGQPLERAMAARLTPATDNGDPRARQWALLSLLTGRSDEARRLVLLAKGGETKFVLLPVERRFERPAAPLTAQKVSGSVGLIRFENSLGDQKTVAAFDVALAGLADTRGLVLDLRDVPSGGDSSVALGIMGRFVRQMLPYQRHRIPNYGQPDVERNWIEQVTPRGPFTYTAPVVVLVDHWTGSMGEGIAIGFDAMRRATVIGTPMAHLAGAVSDFHLPKTGIDVAFATEQIYHVNGTPRQDWLPPILVQDGADSDQDVILQRGLALLNAHP